MYVLPPDLFQKAQFPAVSVGSEEMLHIIVTMKSTKLGQQELDKIYETCDQINCNFTTFKKHFKYPGSFVLWGLSDDYDILFHSCIVKVKKCFESIMEILAHRHLEQISNLLL